MGFDFNPVKIGSGIISKADDIKDKVVETTVSTASIVAGGMSDVAARSFAFQGQLTRIGLEKGLDIAQNVAGTTAGLAGDGLDIAGDIFGRGRDLVGGAVDQATHPGDPNPPAAQGLSFAETKSASDLAYKGKNAQVNDVYQFPDGGQWRVVDVQDDPNTGFRAVAFKPVDPNDERVIVAFSGSDERVDWGDNVKQGVGLSTAQYDAAVDFANKWKASDGGDNVILTGHSLGGGLASYASIKTDLHATAVNSAPLALNHLGLNPFDAQRITQYYVPGEALSVLNEANPLDIRPGDQIAVQGKDSILDPRSVGSNHSLSNVAPDIPAPIYVGNYN